MLIDKYLPDFQFSEKHSISINATRNQIMKAIIELSPKEISFLFNLFFFIRSIPPKVLGRRYFGFNSETPLLKQLEEKGFKLLETNDSEILLGIVGQFGKMKNSKNYKIDDFKNFNEKEAGKVVTNFYITELKNKLSLSKETRIYFGDKKSRRKFALYWLIVYPGSALIRKVWLRAIKKRAEKHTQMH